MNISDLKDQYKNQICYIIGKGSSLDNLKKEHFIDIHAPIITLNETITKIEDMNIYSHPIFSLQQDGVAECMREPKYSFLLLSQVSKQYFPDYRRRIVFSRVKDLGIASSKYTAITAIEIARLMGCNKLIFISFDTCYNGDYGYPKTLGELKKCDSHSWRFPAHCDGIKMQLKGLSASFFNPTDNKSIDYDSENYTIITPTGDRPQLFKLCKKYVLRQSLLPSQWVIIDDGKVPIEQKPVFNSIGIDYIRRKPQEDDPKHTIRVNMLEALKHVKNDKVIIFEDDDWYHKDYCKELIKGLKDYDLYGFGHTTGYHYLGSKYLQQTNITHTGLCMTAFTDKVKPFIKNICEKPENKKYQTMFLDLELWETYNGKKHIKKSERELFIGLKGLPGRRGQTIGHYFKDLPVYKNFDDENRSFLKNIIDEDIIDYDNLVFSGNLLDNEKLQYEKLWVGKQINTHYALPWAEYILEKIDGNFDIKILDIGCGDGTTVKRLRNKYYCIGLDLTLAGLKLNKQQLDKTGFLESSVTDIPFKNKYFDITYSINVLEYLPISLVDKAIQEIFRVTKNVMYHCISTIKNDTTIKNNTKIIQPITWWQEKFNKYNKDNIKYEILSYEDFVINYQKQNKSTAIIPSIKPEPNPQIKPELNHQIKPEPKFKEIILPKYMIKDYKLLPQVDGSYLIEKVDSKILSWLDNNAERINNEYRWRAKC